MENLILMAKVEISAKGSGRQELNNLLHIVFNTSVFCLHLLG